MESELTQEQSEQIAREVWNSPRLTDGELVVAQAAFRLGQQSADVKRFEWILDEPEAAKHLLTLLGKGKGDKTSFRKMVDRIMASKNAAPAEQEREAFERWCIRVSLPVPTLPHVCEEPCRFRDTHMALIGWNASRRAALEEAAAICEQQPYKYKAMHECAAAIRKVIE